MHLDHDHVGSSAEHTHSHDHHHTHEGQEHCSGADCSACGGCPHTPMEELMALMKYMVGHNAAHAQELAGLARQLEEAGAHSSYEQVMQAVSDFEKGNLRLSTVLTALEHERNG
jgi:hypothetical protein